MNILLIDDSEDNRLLLEIYFRKSRYKLTTAENGEIGVEKFKNDKFDFVLMDMHMPIMDGYTAARKIRQWENENKLRATRIIALTADALSDNDKKSLEAGCDTHLEKPITKTKLLKVIDELSVVHIDSDLEELIPGFLGGRQEDIVIIRQALKKGDFKIIEEIGHSMKGNGAGYGFDKISLLGKAIEQAAQKNKFSDINEHIRELSTYLENLKIIFD